METSKNTKIIIFVLAVLLLWSYFHVEKYDGLTAEEWFNRADYSDEKYNEFRSCVEDYDSMSVQEQMDYGGVFYYCE